MKDSLDYISDRVKLSGVVGCFMGTVYGMFKGHHSYVRTAGYTGFSWAMVATVCFGSERLVHAALPRLNDRRMDLLASHGLAGVMGGSILGYLFIRKPRQGIAFFVPAMLLTALAEEWFQNLRERKQQEAAAAASPSVRST